MRRRLTAIVGAALLAAAIVAGVFLLHGGGRPEAGSRLRVIFSGETEGELEPCNCAGKMAGGLPKRAGYLNQQQGKWLLVDTGCVGAGRRDFEALRAEAALRAMVEMNYDAVNVAEHELWLGRDGLEALMAVGPPFVSANVFTDVGAPVAERYRIVRRAGLDVAITGVVESARYEAGEGLVVKPHREVLATLVPQLAVEVGVIVLLADLAEEEVRALAGQFPEITLILYRGRGDSHTPERVNRTVIASIYGEARYLGDMTLTWESASRVSGDGEAVLLDERFPDSKRVTELAVDWYKDAVRGRSFDYSQPGPGGSRIRFERPEADNRYVGSESCRRCHPYQYKVWETKRHARAMKSLEKVGYDRSPECVVCHVVGLAAADGYVSMEKTPELGRVGCETCHGRGYILRNGKCKGLARPGAEPTCRGCHTAKRHPGFIYKVQWEKINHKEPKKK